MNEETSQKQFKRSWSTLFTLVGAILLSFLSLVFAFIQKAEADRAHTLHKLCQTEAQELRIIAEQSSIAAMQQMKLAEQSEERAHQALEECKQNQKK